MKKFAVLAGVLAAFASASAAMAQTQRPKGDVPGPIDSVSDLQDTGRMIFKMADENNDNYISQKEAIDAANLLVGGFFFRADQNGDGVLSQDEERQARDAFLSTKPWLRYVIETARTTPREGGRQGATAGAGANPMALLNSVIDTNNDKQIQASELRTVVQTAVQGLFEQADADHNGQLSPAEVNASVVNVANTAAQAAFQQADTDRNGQISEAEFSKAITEPARVAFRVMDLNHDGQISPQEAQTARQVVMSKLRMAQLPEPSNSPRNVINQAVGSQTQPAAAPAATTPGQPAPVNPPR